MTRIGERALERVHVDTAITGERNGDHFGQALAPAQLVGMVFIGPDKDHRVALMPGQAAQRLTRGRRHGDTEDFLQLVDRRGRACAAGHKTVAGAGIDRRLDDPLGLAHPGIAGPARRAVFAVGIGIVGGETGNHAFDRGDGAAGGGVVGVKQRTRPERGLQLGPGADEAVAQLRNRIVLPRFTKHRRFPFPCR